MRPSTECPRGKQRAAAHGAHGEAGHHQDDKGAPVARVRHRRTLSTPGALPVEAPLDAAQEDETGEPEPDRRPATSPAREIPSALPPVDTSQRRCRLLRDMPFRQAKRTLPALCRS